MPKQSRRTKEYLYDGSDLLKTQGNKKREDLFKDLQARDGFYEDLAAYKKKPSDKNLFKLCDKYEVEPLVICYFAYKDDSKYANYYSILGIEELDLCEVNDNDGLMQYLDSELKGIKISRELRSMLNHLRQRAKLFPRSIAIHKRASQRDVLDYIKKRWYDDYEYSYIRGEDTRGPAIRRKRKREIYDLIYKFHKQGMNLAQIEKAIAEQYDPDHMYTYTNISKIIEIEVKRRRRKFTEPH